MFSRHLGLVIAAAALPLWGCASTATPREVLDARQAYAQAANGPAAQYTPADLEVARQALSKAEQSFADNPDSDETRDLAYIAQVKSLTAEARGRLTASERTRAIADAQFKATAVDKLDAKNSALTNASSALNNANSALATATARTQATGAALLQEQQRRTETELKLRETMDRLAALAAVKEEPRGLVITLSGSVLFATDKSELLTSASSRLDEVAEALKAQPDRSITVLGFTDSTGTLEHNQDLSERRAKSVRAYLIGRGVDAARLTAIGKGPKDPVAENSSPEGRANNRRVEIVLAPAGKDVYSQ